MLRRRLAALAFGTALALVGLGGVEAWCREGERRLEYLWDSPRLFAVRPGVAGTNAWGFHEREIRPEPAAGVRRVVVIGDSVTWGAGPAEEAYPRRVEQALGPPWQVLNLAHYGYDIRQSAAVLRELGWAYAPEIVVYASYTNDPVPSRAIEVDGGHVWVGEGGFLPPLLRQHSALLRRAEGAVLVRRLQDRPDWEFYRASLQDLRDQAVAHGVPLLVLGLVPHVLAEPDLAVCSARVGQPGLCEEHAAIADAQEKVAHALDLPWLGVLPALRASGRTDFYPPDSRDWQHPGPEGHVVFAGVLLKLLAPYAG